MPPRRTTRSKPVPKAESYAHHDADVAMRPDVGTQAQFRKKKAPRTYQYDSSLAPSLEWDGQNHGRERGEELIARIADRLENTRSRYRIMVESLIAEITPLLRESGQEALAEPIIRMLLARRDRAESNLVNAEDACRDLAALSRPFLNWAGKAERLSFDVPTLPLFVHDRLSTKAIIETLKSHRKDAGAEQTDMFDLFGDPQHSVHDQVLRAYEHRDKWTNRMVLGDSLVVMNSLLEYEGLGGQVQMIYMDPPYGVKFGSNFQPFVR
jgi:adenine-specific DNA-methyltransferase